MAAGQLGMEVFQVLPKIFNGVSLSPVIWKILEITNPCPIFFPNDNLDDVHDKTARLVVCRLEQVNKKARVRKTRA